MSKVPCGGFKLDENFLGMNENDELALVGGSEGKAYQQLVTDDNGNPKWEDRLAYEETKEYRLPSNTEGLDSFEAGVTYYKVSNDILDVNVMKKGFIYQASSEQIAFSLDKSVAYDDSAFYDKSAGAIIVCYKTTINWNKRQITVPSTGIYLSNPDLYLKLVIAKKIDSKFIPDSDYIVVNSSTPDSTKRFKITVDDSGTISATEV